MKDAPPVKNIYLSHGLTKEYVRLLIEKGVMEYLQLLQSVTYISAFILPDGKMNKV
jgi:hypothetical protein